MESLIGQMLDGRILLEEAVAEFEKIYIQTALERNSEHLSKTAGALGIHRNTLSKRVASYNGKPTAKVKPAVKKRKVVKKTTARASAKRKTRR
ncbi:MAG TPA: helix-turn-helix domain-containing protein [Pyrinomonadaceae bacterium]|nr:helix-turn-helix domain-containing protein [Pyrinomonadaceae bacterium]